MYQLEIWWMVLNLNKDSNTSELLYYINYVIKIYTLIIWTVFVSYPLEKPNWKILLDWKEKKKEQFSFSWVLQVALLFLKLNFIF